MSAVELSIHRVTKVKQFKIIAFAETDSPAFCTSLLIITNEKGEAVRLTLFAEDKKSLEIRGHDE